MAQRVMSVFPAALSVRPKALENDSAGATSGVGDAGRVEPGTPWVIAGVRLSRRIALAFLRHDMEQASARAEHKRSGNALQFRLVVAVDEAKIVKPISSNIVDGTWPGGSLFCCSEERF